MARFPDLSFEAVVQENDKTRLDASKSFVADETAITLLEIDPDGTNGLVDVTSDGYLDWVYTADGDYTVTVKVTTGSGNTTRDFDISVVTEADDNLFSNDDDLELHEANIRGFLKDGKSSYKNFHRRAQEIILGELDRRGFTDTNGERFTAASIVDIKEVGEWSTFMTLALIFSSISNAIADVFDEKSKHYEELASKASYRAILRIDYDGSGTIGDDEAYLFNSIRIHRR